MSDEQNLPTSEGAPTESAVADAPRPSFEDTLARVADEVFDREPARGENGQFQPKVVADPAPGATEVPGKPGAAPPDPRPEVIEAPQSLPAAVREKWTTLPPDVQKYWAEREGEIHKKFTTEGQRLKEYEGVDTALEIARDFLEQNRIPKVEYIRRLAQADQMLRTNPQQALAQIAHMYGIQAASPGAQPDPNSALTKELLDLRTKVETLSKSSEAASLSAAQEMINEFAKDKPHFPAVESLMNDLIQRGAAASVPGDDSILAKAYRLAIAINPEVKAKLETEAKADADKKAAEEARKKAEQDARLAPLANRPGSAQTAPLKGKTIWDTLQKVGDEVYARS